MAKSAFINAYPRILIEPFGIVILSVVACITVIYEGFNNALPLLVTLALGSQRIIPLMQKIYEGVVKTRLYRDSLILVLEFLNKYKIKDYLENTENKQNFSLNLVKLSLFLINLKIIINGEIRITKFISTLYRNNINFFLSVFHKSFYKLSNLTINFRDYRSL